MTADWEHLQILIVHRMVASFLEDWHLSFPATNFKLLIGSRLLVSSFHASNSIATRAWLLCCSRLLRLLPKAWMATKSGDFKLKVNLRVQLFSKEKNLNEKFKATKKMSCVTRKYHNINRISEIKMLVNLAAAPRAHQSYKTEQLKLTE